MGAMMPEIILIILAVLAGMAASGAIVFFLVRKKTRQTDLLLMQQQLDAIRNQLRETLDGNTKILHQQINDLTSQLHTQLHRQTEVLNGSRKAMDERLDNAARVIGEVQRSMGRVHEALVPVGELRDILKAPKLRGGMGEIMLERLLEEMMPSGMYSIQHGFKDGERVDAMIRIGGQMVPVDSKFPLDKYREYLKAATEDEKRSAKKGLAAAVKKHIGDVAKYIRPDEGTYPFAFMYIPSESIYYELFVGGEADADLWSFAAGTHVFPVSSNTLYIYLQTISFGLRGMQIAEHARDILNKMEQLQKNLADVRKNYDKIGTHLKNAQNAYDDTGRKFSNLETKFTSISAEVPPALAEPAKGEEKTVDMIQ